MTAVTILDRLAAMSIQLLALGMLAFALTRGFRLSARTRSIIWLLVFVNVVAGFAFRVPLPVREPAPEPAPMAVSTVAVPISAVTQAVESIPAAFAPRTPTPGPNPIDVLAGGWAVIAGGLLVFHLARETHIRRRLSMGAYAEPALTAVAAEVAPRLGLRCPRVFVSRGVTVPCVAGVFRPAVYIPDGMDRNDAEAVRAVLAHELAHIRHGDLATSWLALLARCLFFFHPVIWFANREWTLSREAACDAAAMRVARIGMREYCEVLIRFAQARPLGAATIQAATRGFNALHRRICEMKQLNQSRNRGAVPVATIAALVASALIAIPVTFTQRAALAKPDSTSNLPKHSPESTAPTRLARLISDVAQADTSADKRPVTPDVRVRVIRVGDSDVIVQDSDSTKRTPTPARRLTDAERRQAKAEIERAMREIERAAPQVDAESRIRIRESMRQAMAEAERAMKSAHVQMLSDAELRTQLRAGMDEAQRALAEVANDPKRQTEIQLQIKSAMAAAKKALNEAKVEIDLAEPRGNVADAESAHARAARDLARRSVEIALDTAAQMDERQAREIARRSMDIATQSIRLGQDALAEIRIDAQVKDQPGAPTSPTAKGPRTIRLSVPGEDRVMILTIPPTGKFTVGWKELCDQAPKEAGTYEVTLIPDPKAKNGQRFEYRKVTDAAPARREV